jgi:NAD(P)H-hydrate repair Nnr-like enzyme with NAD(P)H-hydrate dehydratase domain
MPLEQHQEKTYPHDPPRVYQAALTAVQKLEGRIVSADAESFRVEAKFPKVILGNTLGERTQLSCQIKALGQGQDQSSAVVIDAYPLDALERKLLFGARKGVTLTVVTWFVAHLEHNLQMPQHPQAGIQA